MRWIFVSFGIAALALLTLLRIADPSGLEGLRNGYFDQLQRLNPRELTDISVRVVDIDETSLAAEGQWPWPRNRLADLVDQIAAADPAVIVFDILFPEPDRLSPARFADDPALQELLEGSQLPEVERADHDLSFAQAIEGRPVVLGVADSPSAAASTTEPKTGSIELGDAPLRGLPSVSGITGNIPVLSEAARGLGSINMSPHETSDVVRRVPLAWNLDERLLPSLALEAVRIATGEDNIMLEGEADTAGKPRNFRVQDFSIPVTSDGNFLLHYRPDDPALYVSAHDLLQDGGDQLRDQLEDHIVLIGTSASGLLDIRATALGENVPGVSIHAQIIEQILSGRFVTRADHIQGFEILSLMIIGGLVLAVMTFSGAIVSVIAVALAGAGVAFTSWYLFVAQGILFDISFPLLSGLGFFAVMTAFQFGVADREKRMLRRSFSHYVAPELLQRIEDTGHRIELGGEVRDITVMFCDIRNFTSLSERIEATEMVALLNDLFSDLSAEILKRQGTIDKYIGDSIMAFWNAPLDIDDHQVAACSAALSMREALKRFNAKMDTSLESPIEVAIGIATGPACVGNIGSRERFNYSAIGAIVNHAARIEAACRDVGYDIVISEQTAEAATDFATLRAGKLGAKGVAGGVSAYVLVGNEALARTDDFMELKGLHDKLASGVKNPEERTDEVLRRCKEKAESFDAKLPDFFDGLHGGRN